MLTNIQRWHGIWLLLIALLLPIGAASAQITGNHNNQCPQPTRLTTNIQARVLPYPNLPNRLRSTADIDSRSNIIGRIPAGGEFTTMHGPVCADGHYWWYVRYGNQMGWTAEGDGKFTYWLEPLAPVPPQPPACRLAPRLAAGMVAQVTPGLPNVVRTHPGTHQSGATYSKVIGEIPGGAQFAVNDGPVCGPDGRYWWRVDYRGLVGWTAEGEGSTYWLEPVNKGVAQCPGALPSRLQPANYMNARVTSYPDLPNTIRSRPSLTNSQKIGSIPAGEAITVLEGPRCADGYAWYRVHYANTTGWTAESGNGFYWLEPR